MKKFLCLLLAVVCGVLCIAYAEGSLTVATKSLYRIDDDNAYFFAKIVNDGDEPIGVGSGKLVGFSADDDILITENYVSTYPSYILLQPGEYAYVREYIWEDAMSGKEITDYRYSLDTNNSSDRVPLIDCEAEMDLEGASSFDNYVLVTITNTTDEILYDMYITVALLDENDNLLYVDGDSYSNLGVHPGSTVTLKVYVENDMMEYYAANGLTPTKVDAIVYDYSDY